MESLILRGCLNRLGLSLVIIDVSEGYVGTKGLLDQADWQWLKLQCFG